ncbi:MAG: cryptochrome/photolyase family protein [Acidobacteria bacterium]|nr:cryptochrome/photolyase family protein [Acidobacteriota bacterium]
MDGRRPEGGAWNLDAENRKTWRGGPPAPARPVFPVDDITREVIELVNSRYPDAPGTTEGFNWPVTPEAAAATADAFFATRLASFGPYEDAIADTEPELFHSALSASINLGQLDPLALCPRAEAASRQGDVPLASAEGFIRQILGWRELCGMSTTNVARCLPRSTRLTRTCRCRRGTGGSRRGCAVWI